MTLFTSSIFSSFFRLLYPRACVVCGDVLVDGEPFLCSACLSGLPLNEGVDEEADKVLAERAKAGILPREPRKGFYKLYTDHALSAMKGAGLE